MPFVFSPPRGRLKKAEVDRHVGGWEPHKRLRAGVHRSFRQIDQADEAK